MNLLVANLPLLLYPGGAAVAGLLIGLLLRGKRATGGLAISKTEAFAVEQSGGTLTARKTTLAEAESGLPVELVYEIHVPSDMPVQQRMESMRQVAS